MNEICYNKLVKSIILYLLALVTGQRGLYQIFIRKLCWDRPLRVKP